MSDFAEVLSGIVDPGTFRVGAGEKLHSLAESTLREPIFPTRDTGKAMTGSQLVGLVLVVLVAIAGITYFI